MASKASEMPVSDDIQYIRLYIPRQVYLHGYVAPFLIFYMIWLYVWLVMYGVQEYFEAGLIAVAGIGILQILTCLSCFWSVHVRCALTCKSVLDVHQATVAKVVPTPNNGYPEIVKIHHDKDEDSNRSIIWFSFQKTKYLYDAEEKKQFHSVPFPVDRKMHFYKNWKGFNEVHEIEHTNRIFGDNKLELIVPEFSELFKERATAPFFVFQVFCVALWCLDEYWYYSIFTLAMLVMFEATLVQQQLRNLREIRNMGSKPYMINVFRQRKWRLISSSELVPGDICSIVRYSDDRTIPCDMLLLRGPCIVDEAMLTGESVPQMKEPVEDIEDSIYLDPTQHSKLHILFGGTKVVQHTPPPKNSNGIRSSDNGCIAYVLRTGFHTSQGKLLRTILYGVKRVTANNLETFCFILFLLIFAIAAAAYVWIKGTEDPSRNRYKLFLECTFILTSVVPPELPIELSLAVNSSLMSLIKLGIYCTEPFRIPFAGKIDVCCFDKTGTLTSDNLIVTGIAGLKEGCKLTEISEAPMETLRILGTCHSLAKLDETFVGDPLEKAALKAIDWSFTKDDVAIPRKGFRQTLRIVHRFHFSSVLKRMSVICSMQTPQSSISNYIVTTKGAPEILKRMFKEVPKDYDSVHEEMARKGARILALGYKEIGELTSVQLREMTREQAENELIFAGFVVISCPLKYDSKAVIKDLKHSSHHLIMITGDSALTACHVAKELEIVTKPTLILKKTNNDDWLWQSIDRTINLPLMEVEKRNEFVSKYCLCVTGEGLPEIIATKTSKGKRTLFETLLPFIQVFARMAPKQKEIVITTLRERGFITLMCGDGTNDVGALKHANVGVALLTHAPQPKAATKFELSGKDLPVRSKYLVTRSPLSNQNQKMTSTKSVAKLLKDIDEGDQPSVVKLGDASIASPFTFKFSSTICTTHIIRQGRCTLVTTLQMFKILALNALVLAYSQSVLYLDGIKFSDSQATLQGVLLAGCFLFISRSKPLHTLSKQRPLPNIFNTYTILTVLSQFFVHFTCLVYLVQEAKALVPPREEKFVNLDAKFEPNLINSVVYLISITLQISTFAVNHRGHPFMASLTENKPLLYSILLSSTVIGLIAVGLAPELSYQFEIVEIPVELRNKLASVLVADFILAYVLDSCCQWLLGEAKLKCN
ncbi:uncharacterized protein TRIADDRAFT_20897 [Trichoplax adhaerens]|uniref:Cation-transporting ATPase n=1 Tax=Trichoplax adhaerens TaxID=10228 RepID=B3RP74_TRIAD|nr:hypothetical protein TRIADDRAFT_20897 [Trichoplax adhaerens]EDV27584.1 hypothetical protein TRIADDRAFT_20897 [Trichoplax adhaerens]|eukprot:XP_002109418.1 hypothetical protein TRIADDRAFT_20897 [Trichoplax adhaerens]